MDARGVGVTVTTVTGEVITGHVFSYTPDPAQEGNGFLTIRQESIAEDPQTCDYRMLRTAFIQDCVVDENAKDVKLHNASFIGLPERMSKEKKQQERASRIAKGKQEGVSDLAQSLFDRINRQMHCRWEGKNIIVDEVVKIVAPYRAESCSRLDNGSTKALQYIQSLLEASQ
eukprot:m.33165 g.33165  ORF g.33165 m.33165 type:complete len:172 (+) comp6436_c2_seq1:28-543(+)